MQWPSRWRKSITIRDPVKLWMPRPSSKCFGCSTVPFRQLNTMSSAIEFVNLPIELDLDVLFFYAVKIVSMSFKRISGGLNASPLIRSGPLGHMSSGISLNLFFISLQMIFPAFNMILSGSWWKLVDVKLSIVTTTSALFSSDDRKDIFSLNSSFSRCFNLVR